MMNKDEVLSAVKTLSKGQGFYARLLREIEERPEVLDELVKLKCKDIVDLVLAIEC